MKYRILLACALLASAAGAQDPAQSVRADSTDRIALPPIRIQHMKPRDMRGLNIFEPPKHDTVSYRGFAVQWGAAFTQAFQSLSHENTADPNVVNNVNLNQLITIGRGFNNALANLYMDTQLARGLRIQLTSYLSARHHQETWVKDGYFLIDESPWKNDILDRVFEDVTLRIGHFEVNYGDMHFRRSDNGNAMHNPFVGNLMLDAFTTEIGLEAYWRKWGFMAMGGATGGEVHGQVTAPERRSPAWLGKLGYDGYVWDSLRVRLTASTYISYRSASNTLFTGDRGGSPYYDVMENVNSTETAQAWSGNVRPGFSNVVHAYVFNPFLKYRGFEFFGNVETATGKANAEPQKRTIRQLAGEGLYRFLDDKLYGGLRYNVVNGQLVGIPNDITVKRLQVGGGWFVIPTLLAKLEYIDQRYEGFPSRDIRNGGRFNGLMATGTVAF